LDTDHIEKLKNKMKYVRRGTVINPKGSGKLTGTTDLNIEKLKEFARDHGIDPSKVLS
jgi:hypothetical protein